MSEQKERSGNIASAISLRGVDDFTDIKTLIYRIRGRQVMLDSDLAVLYQVETRRVNESVKRNQARFPESFCFQLTKSEYENLMSQIATSSSGSNHGGRRKLPHVFTEQGVAMLSAVLHSDIAVAVSVRIMEAFVALRRFSVANAELLARIQGLERRQDKTDQRLDFIFEFIGDQSAPCQKLFFEGQLYDAFSLIVDLIQEAKKKIIVVDGYVDTKTLNILAKKHTGVEVVVWTKPNCKLTTMDVDLFNAQYPLLSVRYSSSFHDRFLVIDEKTCYHVGASLKDAGKKCFALSRLVDPSLAQAVLRKVQLSERGTSS